MVEGESRIHKLVFEAQRILTQRTLYINEERRNLGDDIIAFIPW